MIHYCPYCYKDSPKGLEPSMWACCGEVGHAVACNVDDNEGRCTADTSKDDNGDRCVRCEAKYQEDAAYWRCQWESALPSERDPDKYRESMIDAGRGHLVKREGFR
jgi:hypothetical protein